MLEGLILVGRRKPLWAQQSSLRKYFVQNCGNPKIKVVCKLQLGYHSSTSNLRAHIENMHTNEHGLMFGTPPKQPRVDSFYTTCHKIAICSTTRVLHKETLDRRPTSIVDRADFSEFCHGLEPRYHISSHGTITSTSDKNKGITQMWLFPRMGGSPQ